MSPKKRADTAALSGSCSLLRTSPRGATTACPTPATGDGLVLCKSIPRSCFRALLMLSLMEAYSSHEAATMHSSTPRWTGKGLKKTWCFTCCHSEHTWQLPWDSTRLSCVCEATCSYLRALCCACCPSSQGEGTAARPREPAPAQGWRGTTGKVLSWEKGGDEHEHRPGQVTPLGSAGSCAGEEQAKKCWACINFHLGTPSGTESSLS